MRDAVLLFESVLAQSCFKRSAITLVLTKADLFRKKLNRSPIRRYFPDYEGPGNDSFAVQQFFIDQFLACNKDPDRTIRVFCTDGTDTEEVKPVLDSIITSASSKRKEWAHFDKTSLHKR